METEISLIAQQARLKDRVLQLSVGRLLAAGLWGGQSTMEFMRLTQGLLIPQRGMFSQSNTHELQILMDRHFPENGRH